MSFGWSPDSRWLAYTLTNAANFQTLRIYSIAKDESVSLNDGLAETSSPRFDASGKYLYFLGSTDAGPVKNWFDQSNADMRATHSLYLAVLRKDLPSPLKKLSDEEEAGEEKEKPKDKESKDRSPRSRSTSMAWLTESSRCPYPWAISEISMSGSEGQIYYLRAEVLPPGAVGPESKPKTVLHHYDLKKLEDEVLAEGIEGFLISGDRKSFSTTRASRVGSLTSASSSRATVRSTRGDFGENRPASRMATNLS